MKRNQQLVTNLSGAAVIWALLILGISLVGCTDDCENSETYVYMQPVYTPASEVRASFASMDPTDLENPGKIYRKDHYLFINELGKGIHIFNNNDKSNPQPLSFVNIPGSFDIAVKGDVMYVDSFVDLVVMDISDPTNVKQLARLENVIDNFEIMGFWNDENSGFITDFVQIETTEVYDCDQFGSPEPLPGGVWLSLDQANSLQSASPGAARSGSPGSGLGGSFARFAITQDFLYVVDNWSMHVFGIGVTDQPVKLSTQNLGWGIETIFPYNNNLFIGSNTGMQIFDNSNPQSPVFLSEFSHARACDPVVAQGDFAYVTLRSNIRCFGNTNQLDVINISNLSSPFLVRTYPMQDPHGLSVDGDFLFLCEGKHGLKVFNIGDKHSVDQNLLTHITDVDAYDVIAIDSHLIMVGSDGIYQYDYSDPANLKLLSIISSGS